MPQALTPRASKLRAPTRRAKKANRCHPESPSGVRDLHFVFELAVVGAGVYDRPGVAVGFRR